MDMVNIKLNGMPLAVPKGSTILEAARYAGIEIPTLCYLKRINEIGACRICVSKDVFLTSGVTPPLERSSIMSSNSFSCFSDILS